MQECLAMREKYVFREKVHPWNKDVLADPSTPKPNLDPFHYVSEAASKVLSSIPLFVGLSASYSW